MSDPKVARYHFQSGPDYKYYMEANPIGSWVRYSDYEALAARVQELEGEAHEEIRRTTSVEDAYDRLLAENKRLREALVGIAVVKMRDPDQYVCRVCGWEGSGPVMIHKKNCPAALKEKP